MWGGTYLLNHEFFSSGRIIQSWWVVESQKKAKNEKNLNVSCHQKLKIIQRYVIKFSFSEICLIAFLSFHQTIIVDVSFEYMPWNFYHFNDFQCESKSKLPLMLMWSTELTQEHKRTFLSQEVHQFFMQQVGKVTEKSVWKWKPWLKWKNWKNIDTSFELVEIEYFLKFCM